MNVILFGAPGVGKGTQAEILGRRLGVPHVSTGAIFREATAAGSELGAKAKEYMDAGLLVPDDITTAMALDKLAEPQCSEGFVLDGYPRNPAQAAALDQALSASGRRVDNVVHLVVPTEEIVTRMLKRGRGDDTEDVILTRLKVYDNETEPVLAFFRERGVVSEVNGVGEIDEVNDRILCAIGVTDSKPIE